MSEYVYVTDGHEGHWLTGEEIVRCRDCRYCKKHRDDYRECLRWSEPLVVIGGDGFCAWGERRDT